MTGLNGQGLFARSMSEYGMVLVLLALCAYYSLATMDWQSPSGAAGGRDLARQIVRDFPVGSRVLIVARDNPEDVLFAETLSRRLQEAGMDRADVVTGQPSDARAALDRVVRSGQRLDLVACNQSTADWGVFENVGERFPALAGVPVVVPRSYRWPSFLMPDNLLNVASQITILAILAIGMTLVILTGGIDLSVGSLIALSAVLVTLLIRDAGGGDAAGTTAMTICSLAAIAVCGVVGLFSGLMTTLFRIPPFVVTLAMMFVASGLAYRLSNQQSIDQVPDSFTWLGRGADLFGIPNAIILMLLLYALAHLLMTRTSLGRYVYATGGNAEAARLSGVRIHRVVTFAYVLSGALAGLGGVIMASRLKSGAPTYGLWYELYTIAAVVVGGASLSGGEGRILGTLIGALIIGVIQNGMNLTGVQFDNQRVVLGAVLLGAVLFDTLKRRGGGSFLARMLSRRA